MYGRLIGGSMSDDYNEEMTEKMSKEDKKVYGDYDAKCRAESDVHTLIEAKEIRDDADRYKKAMYCAKSKAKHMNSIVKED